MVCSAAVDRTPTASGCWSTWRAAQAAAVFLGIWSGGDPWLAAVVVTVIAALATLFCNAFGVPPAAYQIVLVGATGTAMAAQGADPVRTSLLVLAGGVFAGLVHVVPAIVDLRSPERRIVATAAEDVAGYLEAIGGPEVDRARHQAAERLYEAWLMLVNQQPLGRHPGPELLRLRELARQIQLLVADAMRRDRPDPGAADRARRLGRQALLRRSLQMTYVPVSLPLGRPTRMSTLRYALPPGVAIPAGAGPGHGGGRTARSARCAARTGPLVLGDRRRGAGAVARVRPLPDRAARAPADGRHHRRRRAGGRAAAASTRATGC